MSRNSKFSFLTFLFAVAAFCLSLGPYLFRSVSAAEPSLQSGQATIGTVSAISAIPSTFTYQGVLRLPDSKLANGAYNMTFRIYGSVTGGTAIHTELINNIVVRDGVFSVILGDAQRNPIGDTVFTSAPRYVGITVNTDPEMAPRQRIHPVPWALMSNFATNSGVANQALTVPDGSISNSKLANGIITTQKLADGAITANQLANGAITADKVAVGQLLRLVDNSSDYKIQFGTIAVKATVYQQGSSFLYYGFNTLTFPTPFSTTPFISLTAIDTYGNSISSTARTVSATDAVVQIWSRENGLSATVHWIAIGK